MAEIEAERDAMINALENSARALRLHGDLIAMAPRPTAGTARETLFIPEDQVLSLVQEPTSLDIPIGEDGEATLADLIEAPDAVNPYAAAEFASLKACVAEALSELSPREERILRMRFGIGMSDHTLEQVGQTFGVTRERIRQIEAKALEKLRAPARMRKLSTFAE